MDFLDKVIDQIARLPGLGKRGATRIAYDLLKRDPKFSRELGLSLVELRDRIRRCEVCRTYTEISPCSVCADTTRDPSLLCVVENPQEIATINTTGEYKGYFFVLHGLLSPLDGIGATQLGFPSLLELVRTRGVRELILATSSSPEGEATALYIKQMTGDPSLVLSRLASGLPVGGAIDNADRLTMMRSLQGRTRL